MECISNVTRAKKSMYIYIFIIYILNNISHTQEQKKHFRDLKVLN